MFALSRFHISIRIFHQCSKKVHSELFGLQSTPKVPGKNNNKGLLVIVGLFWYIFLRGRKTYAALVRHMSS